MATKDKRVCIVNTRDMPPLEEGDEVIKAGDRVLRTTRSFAEKLIQDTKDGAGVSGWAYTSKGKLKSFLNKNGKLHRNFKYLERLQGLFNENYPERRWLGNIMLEVPTIEIRIKEEKMEKIKVPVTNKGFKLIEHRSTERYDTKTGTWKPVKARKQIVDLSQGRFKEPFQTMYVAPESPLFRKNQEVMKTGRMRIVAAFA